MNKKFTVVFFTVLFILIVMVTMGPFYILDEGQQAILIRFGKIVDTQRDAGLKIKIPFVDNVLKYSKKILSWDGKAQEIIPTNEKLFIWVDVTARWKIIDPAQFYASVTYLDSANNRLNEFISSSVKTVIANNSLREAVRNSNLINEVASPTTSITSEDTIIQRELEKLESRSGSSKQERIERGREVLSNDIFKAVSSLTPQFGIELIDIIVRQIRYSDVLTESVYKRMVAERNQEAQIFRSTGEGQKAEWLGKLQNEQKTILSLAYNEAEKIKGIADAKAAKIYADSYAKDPEFFEFWRSIESYKKTMPQFNKTITTDMQYFKYLENRNAR